MSTRGCVYVSWDSHTGMFSALLGQSTNLKNGEILESPDLATGIILKWVLTGRVKRGSATAI